MKCFEDMLLRGRYCVLASEHIMLKDAYLIALAQNEVPPGKNCSDLELLQLYCFMHVQKIEYLITFSAVLLPFDGPGIPVNHPPMVICVIVRFKDRASALAARAADTAASSVVNTKQELQPPAIIFNPQPEHVKEIPLEPRSKS